MTYSRAIIFTKHTDLMPYFTAKRNQCTNPAAWDKDKERYMQKRDVQLILQIRYEQAKMVCRIKCPINPLPIKGEFEVCHPGALFAFLKKEGWEMQGNYSSWMFK